MNRSLTFGERAVGLTFNPSGEPLVTKLKEHIAAFIDECDELRGRDDSSPEVRRMCSIAITEAQAAQMWAVKAATWKD